MKRWELVCDRGGDVQVLSAWRWEFPPLAIAVARNWWVERGHGPDRAYIVRRSPAGFQELWERILEIRRGRKGVGSVEID